MGWWLRGDGLLGQVLISGEQGGGGCDNLKQKMFETKPKQFVDSLKPKMQTSIKPRVADPTAKHQDQVQTLLTDPKDKRIKT